MPSISIEGPVHPLLLPKIIHAKHTTPGQKINQKRLNKQQNKQNPILLPLRLALRELDRQPFHKSSDCVDEDPENGGEDQEIVLCCYAEKLALL